MSIRFVSAILITGVVSTLFFGCAASGPMETEGEEHYELSDLAVAEEGEFHLGEGASSFPQEVSEALGACLTYDGGEVSSCEVATTPGLEPQGQCGLNCVIWYPTFGKCYFYVGDQKKCGDVWENCCGGRVCFAWNC